MIEVQRHRGPDAQGTRCFEGGGVGHARLAILDLRPQSNQPFVIDEGDLVLTYNGEIFNFPELRAELEALGCRFTTTSDTEVLIKAYREWGPDAVRRFNGMWAFALYDRKQDLLFCSRDRFGIKPFHYALHDGQFLFASEAKALLAVRPELASPDFDSLSRFLRAGVGASTRRSFFAGIERLEPGCNLFVTRTGTRLERYWDYPLDDDGDITPEDAASRLRELLVDALRIRLISDVPVGSTLSSGVDSSALVCLLRTFDQSTHETFTAAYPGEAVDEGPRAARLSAELGMVNHAIVATTDDFLPLMGKIVHHMDAPNGNPGTLPLWNIMAQMRTRVTVAIEGQGSDELLAGYEWANLGPLVADALRAGRPLEAARQVRCFASLYGSRRTALWLGRGVAPTMHRRFRALRGDEAVYVGPLRGGPDDNPLEGPIPPYRDHLNSMLHRDHATTLRTLLQRGDAVSMAHSMESRVPFLDHRLVEFAFRLPGRLKARDGVSKAVLRDAVRGVVPDDLLAVRPKHGFTTPIQRWFRDEAERCVHPVLLDDRCRARGLFDPIALKTALARHREGRVDLQHQIFRWIGVETWFQEFIDRP